MGKSSKNIIRIVIGIKFLYTTLIIISIIFIEIQQLTYHTSSIPEHTDFLKEKEGVTLTMIIFLIPILLSLIIDFKELKKELLKTKWYIITTLYFVGYVLISQLKNHYIQYVIVIGMIVVSIFIIRKINRINKPPPS